MRRTRRETAEEPKEATAPPADDPAEVPSLTTPEAEAERLEVVRLAEAIERIRAAMPDKQATAAGVAHGAGASAAMAGDLSGEPSEEVIREALEAEVRRTFAEGALEVAVRQLRSAVVRWRLAIDASLVPAAVAVEAILARHAASRPTMQRQASREASEQMAKLPPGTMLAGGWRAPAELAWQAEMERLELLRSRLRAVRPSLAAWAPEDTEGLWRAVRLARSGPYE
jgi:hypothetical protein